MLDADQWLFPWLRIVAFVFLVLFIYLLILFCVSKMKGKRGRRD